MPGPTTSGPLAGLRVLDLTTVVMGPSATATLADLGADVIKVEPPGGDLMRWIGPARRHGMGPIYLQANHGKRGVVLDLKTPEGMAGLRGLIADADVLVSNIRPQAMARLGLGYEAVREINSGIVYCTAVGYGSGGPYSGQAVYDDLMQAASGVSGLFQAVDGAPRYAPVNLCDRVVGLYVVVAVTSALYHRQATGEGQAVEVPMFETMAQFVLADHVGGHAFEPPAGPVGYNRLLSRFRGPYPTKDGYLSVAVYQDRDWRRFSELIGRPDLVDTDPRFRDQDARTRHAEEVGRLLADHLPARTTQEWLDVLGAADIPACRVNLVEDLFDDPHLAAVGFFETAEHHTEGPVRTCRFPITFGRTPTHRQRLAPALGEHNDELLPGPGGEGAHP